MRKHNPTPQGLDTKQTKRCSTCEVILPVSEFYKDRSRPDGLEYRCRSCEKIRWVRRPSEPKAPQENPDDYIVLKTCRDCDELKPMDEFKLHSPSRFNRSNVCKKCSATQYRGKYFENYDRYRAPKEEYRKENWERINKVAQKYRKAHTVQQKAHSAVRYAIITGRLVKQPCQECSEQKVHFHHTNGYDEDNWLTGIWLCSKHHSQLHKEIREAARFKATLERGMNK